MPKLIDYPRTSYAGAWEVADVVDDTGGKSALETCARKLNRKVSGSFKAIVGSAVKFGLLTSKRELLTTTTLFRRIKHAYDKQEELLFHREAFLTPPLFTQLCRKFRSRELPVPMLDIMLIREFDVEEINAQNVAKAFVDGARMVGLLDERNIIADIDQLAAQQPPRRELASPELGANSFRAEISRAASTATTATTATAETQTRKAGTQEAGFESNATSAAVPTASTSSTNVNFAGQPVTVVAPGSPAPIVPATAPLRGQDAVANLFGLPDGNAKPAEYHYPERHRPEPGETTLAVLPTSSKPTSKQATATAPPASPPGSRLTVPAEMSRSVSVAQPVAPAPPSSHSISSSNQGPQSATDGHQAIAAAPLSPGSFRIELSGPGLNTVLVVQDEDDLALARVLLDKIGRQLKK